MSRTRNKLSESLYTDLSNYIDVRAPSWGPDSTSFEVACYRLRDSFLKKFEEDDRPSQVACDAALKKFLAVNQRCKTWELSITSEVYAEVLGLLKQEIYDFWFNGRDDDPIVWDYYDLLRAGRSGPGASIGASGYDFYSKWYASSHSCTQRVADIWPSLIRKEAEYWFIPGQPLPDVSVTDHSKLSFVHKNVDIARTICTEPSANMWLQLGMGSLLERRLSDFFGISMSKQPDVNRALAIEASLTGRLVTIDLESASDSMAMSMLKTVLPRGMFQILDVLRSPYCLLPDKESVPLHMISTMGNGFTFPLQTMLFSSVIRAVYRFLAIPPLSRGRTDNRNWGVFGDDIICLPGTPLRLVLGMLSMLGFTVNSSKSYVEGPFRESCGVDGHLAVNVRPVYLKRLRSLQDHFVAINRLIEWCACHNAILPRTVAELRKPLKGNLYAVPLDENRDAGLHIPLSLIPRRTVKGSSGLYRYTCSVAQSVGWQVKGNGFIGSDCPPVFDPHGLEKAFIGGYIRGQKCPVRQRATFYVTKRRVVPNWDYRLPQPFVPLWGQDGLRRLVSAWMDHNFGPPV